MRVAPAPHRWSVTPRQAIAIQGHLASQVRATKPRKKIRFVAGADVALSKSGERCYAAVVLWDLKEEKVVEEHVAGRRLRFPYVPGLLSFRECPAVLAALRKLRSMPDCLMCDGHGLAHPRRFGLACHVGVICGVPTIGCAKSRLVGVHRTPGLKRGSSVPLTDDGDLIGRVLRTRDGVRPVYVSVGHRIDLTTAQQVVLRSNAGYRIPEPTRLADIRVGAAAALVASRAKRPLAR
jgi:deoxyribonuclease V